MDTLNTWVYICTRITPGSWEHDIKLVTASSKRANSWLGSVCAAEPDVIFFYTRRLVEDLS